MSKSTCRELKHDHPNRSLSTKPGQVHSCVLVDPTNADVCYASGNYQPGGPPYVNGVIKTIDGGVSWSDISFGVDGAQPHTDFQIMAFGSDGTLWLGSDGGIWRSPDGGSHWLNRNAGLGVIQFYTLAVHPTDPMFITGGTQETGTARYSGALGWPELLGGDGGPCPIEWDSPNIHYSTFVYMTDMRRYDSGVYRAVVTGPWAAAGDRASWCNGPFIADPNLPNTLLCGTYRVWRTTDSGSSWGLISGDVAPSGAHLRGLAVASGASNTIYAAGSAGRVYLTTDAANWVPRSTGLPLNTALPDIIVDPNAWQTAYLCADRSTGGRVYKTVNAGVSWLSITGDLVSGVRGMCLAMDFRVSPPRMYLGTDYGLYASTNGGAHWFKASTALPNSAIYDVAVDTANNYLVAATHGRGMWRAPLDVTAPAVALLSPNGGESWSIGATHDIAWNATDAGGVGSVDLQLSTDGGASYPTLIATGVQNTGTYAWMVPGPASMACRVRVTAADSSGNAGVDTSDLDFAIAESTSVAVRDLGTGDFALRVLSGNPVRLPALFRYEIPSRSRVAVEIFDATGRRVRQIEENLREAGAHTAIWDGRDASGRSVSSGIFFIRLRAGALERSRRVAVVR